MQVGVSIAWQVIVDSKVDTLDINTTTKYVGGDTDSFIELLELLITLNAGWGVSKAFSKRLDLLTAPPG
jgi:hypothetical protein